MAGRVLRERAHEVTLPHAEPLPVSTPAHQWAHWVAELLWPSLRCPDGCGLQASPAEMTSLSIVVAAAIAQ